MIGDVITAVDDRPVAKVEDLLVALDHAAPDQQVRVAIQRGTERVSIELKLVAGR